ncbi:MAG: hypothetical protein ACLQLG_01430 [Thermoguttaceae bacterium]
MEISRNQYFLVGLLVLMVGYQFFLIDTIRLTPHVAQFLAEHTGQPMSDAATLKTSIRPPEWLSWSLMSIGAVLVLHSWAMKKPGG